jgi:hypothetical protein
MSRRTDCKLICSHSIRTQGRKCKHPRLPYQVRCVQTLARALYALFGQVYGNSQTDLDTIYVQDGNRYRQVMVLRQRFITNVHPVGVFHLDINLSVIPQLLRLEQRLVLLLRFDKGLLERIGICRNCQYI